MAREGPTSFAFCNFKTRTTSDTFLASTISTRRNLRALHTKALCDIDVWYRMCWNQKFFPLCWFRQISYGKAKLLTTKYREICSAENVSDLGNQGLGTRGVYCVSDARRKAFWARAPGRSSVLTAKSVEPETCERAHQSSAEVPVVKRFCAQTLTPVTSLPSLRSLRLCVASNPRNFPLAPYPVS